MGAGASWLVYGLGTDEPAMWASASAGLTSAPIVCTLLRRRSEHRPVLNGHAATRRRDSVTTRTLATAGV
jgi:hypothetical protein